MNNINNTNANTNANTNTNTNTNTEPNSNIYIQDLINQLENLGSEKEKDGFIKNYAKLKEQIVYVDNVLEHSQTLGFDSGSGSETDFNKYSIQELFDILESNSALIENPNLLEITQLKMLLKVSKILEEKINTETLNIIESK